MLGETEEMIGKIKRTHKWESRKLNLEGSLLFSDIDGSKEKKNLQL